MFYQRVQILNDLLFFFFAVFVFGSTFSIALAQSAFGISLALFLIICAFRKYNPFVTELRWFYLTAGLYVFWMLVAAVMGQTPMRSALIIKEEWLFCIVPVGIYLLRKEGYRRKVVIAFAVGVVFFSLYGILQHFTGVNWTKKVPPNVAPDFGYIVKGTFPHSMTFGNYYGVAAAFFAAYFLVGRKSWSRGFKSFIGLTAFLAVAVTLFSYNRGAILGLIICGIMLTFLLAGRKLSFGLLTAAVVAVALFFIVPGMSERVTRNLSAELDPNNGAGRIFIWSNAVKIATANPVFGVGQGNFEAAYPEYPVGQIDRYKKQVHAHDDFLNIAAIAGVPGFLFFAGIWGVVLAYFWRGWRRTTGFIIERPYLTAALAGSLVFLVTSLTEATFADEEVRQMLMFVWAVGLSPWHPARLQKNGNSHLAHL